MTSLPSGAALRVATFNILHGTALARGMPHDADIAAAAVLLDADVVGLQEVDRGQPRSGGTDQTALIAESLGAVHHRFVPALRGTPGPVRAWEPAWGDGAEPVDGPTYGVGLVSRLPVRAWFVRRFPPASLGLPVLVQAQPRARLLYAPDEPRVAIAAVVDGPRGPLTVLTAHLSFVPVTAVGQLRALARWARTFPSPRIMAGDLNLPGALPRWLTGWHQPGRAATYPSYAPRVQFDHILTDGLPTTSAQRSTALQLPVSDHRAFILDLEL